MTSSKSDRVSFSWLSCEFVVSRRRDLLFLVSWPQFSPNFATCTTVRYWDKKLFLSSPPLPVCDPTNKTKLSRGEAKRKSLARGKNRVSGGERRKVGQMRFLPPSRTLPLPRFRPKKEEDREHEIRQTPPIEQRSTEKSRPRPRGKVGPKGETSSSLPFFSFLFFLLCMHTPPPPPSPDRTTFLVR